MYFFLENKHILSQQMLLQFSHLRSMVTLCKQVIYLVKNMSKFLNWFNAIVIIISIQWAMTNAILKVNFIFIFWSSTSKIILEVNWSEVPQYCPALCNPMDCSLSGSSVHEIFQARILERVAISFSSGSSQPRDRTQVSRIVGRCFYHLRHQLPRARVGSENGELLFSGYGVSVWEDEKVLELDNSDGCWTM